jgi:hypothetical protein
MNVLWFWWQGLSDGLLSQLRMRQMGTEYALAWVHGLVASGNTGALPEVLPAQVSAEEALEGGVFIGAVLLSLCQAVSFCTAVITFKLPPQADQNMVDKCLHVSSSQSIKYD